MTQWPYRKLLKATWTYILRFFRLKRIWSWHEEEEITGMIQWLHAKQTVCHDDASRRTMHESPAHRAHDSRPEEVDAVDNVIVLE